MSAFGASLTDFDNWLLSPHQGTISLQIVQQILHNWTYTLPLSQTTRGNVAVSPK